MRKSDLPTTLESIAGRVSYLIRVWHGSNVTKAAEAIGLPQRMLARIATGAVLNPRAAVLQRIASAYQCSLEWLISGTGPTPTGPGRPYVSEFVALRMAMGPVAFTPKSEHAVRDLATRWYRLTCELESPNARRGTAVTVPAEFGDVAAAELEAWARWLRIATNTYGAEAVQRVLERYGADVPPAPKGQLPTWFTIG